MSSTYQTLQCLLYSGQGVGTFFVQAFRQQISMQNCRPSSFDCTNTTALHQALWLGLIAPDSNISCRWFQTSSTNCEGIHLNHSLKGVSSVTYLNPDYDIAQWSGVGIAQPHTGDFGAYEVGNCPHLQWMITYILRCDFIYLGTIVQEGHTTFSIYPHSSYISEPHTIAERGLDSRRASVGWFLCLGSLCLGALHGTRCCQRGLGSLHWCCPLLPI